jgi:hypothetical protein
VSVPVTWWLLASSRAHDPRKQAKDTVSFMSLRSVMFSLLKCSVGQYKMISVIRSGKILHKTMNTRRQDDWCHLEMGHHDKSTYF